VEYRTLGRTGIQVSELCLGTMMFGGWGNRDEAECRRMVDTALDAGINFIDTADEYAFGGSEEMVGRVIRGRRDRIVLATKFHHQMGEGRNRSGNSRRWIMIAVEDSLRRLGTDYIDLYQVHRPDPATDIDETLGALSDLIRHGKVRAVGTSAFPAEQLVEAQWASQRRGRERFATEQPSYSIFARHAEAGVLPVAERFGLGVFVWSPLNGGWLTGKYRRGAPPPEDSRAAKHPDYFDFGQAGIAERKLDLVERLAELASEAGLTLIQLALGFVLSHRAVTAAIIGPRTHEQLDSQLPAAGVRLGDDVLDRIDALVPPGTTLNPEDVGWIPPALTDSRLRRRSGVRTGRVAVNTAS
jgi:aryl-alcohol dehydrogenase-like predicted oxidoreductase